MRLLPLCGAAVAAGKAQDRWCPPPRLPPRTNQNISIITEFHSKVTPSDDFNLRAHNTGGAKTMGFRYTATALSRFAYWHLVVAGFSDVHVVVTHLREDLEPLTEFLKMKCVAAWRDAGRLTFSTEAVRRRSCRDRQLECRKVRAIRNAYLRLRSHNTWIAYGDVDELFYTEDGRSIAAEMATYEEAVRSVCIPTYVYHDVKERDLPSIRSRAYSGYGYLKEANGGQGECWKSIHRTSHIDRPGIHEAESNDTMARDTSWRVSRVLFVFATFTIASRAIDVVRAGGPARCGGGGRGSRTCATTSIPRNSRTRPSRTTCSGGWKKRRCCVLKPLAHAARELLSCNIVKLLLN